MLVVALANAPHQHKALCAHRSHDCPRLVRRSEARQQSGPLRRQFDFAACLVLETMRVASSIIFVWQPDKRQEDVCKELQLQPVDFRSYVRRSGITLRDVLATMKNRLASMSLTPRMEPFAIYTQPERQLAERGRALEASRPKLTRGKVGRRLHGEFRDHGAHPYGAP